MDITEIQSAITGLPAEEIDELITWLQDYRVERLNQEITDDITAGSFDSMLSDADANGEPSSSEESDIIAAHEIVKESTAALDEK